MSRWLKPADFAHDSCAGIYGELQLMRAANNPIDPVTLAWRAERVGLRGPACDALLASPSLDDASADPLALSRRVLESSVQAAVLVTAESLQAQAQTSQQSATAVACARLNNLWPQQRRWCEHDCHRSEGNIRGRLLALYPTLLASSSADRGWA